MTANTLAAGVLLVLTAQFTSAALETNRNIPYADAASVLHVLRDDLLPAELQRQAPGQLESLWPGWVSRRDAEIRGRLTRGDEDSIVNFLLYGLTFTAQPRLTLGDTAPDPAALTAITNARMEDMVSGAASPGSNERLQFVHDTLARLAIDPATPTGRVMARDFLRRIVGEYVNEVHSLSGQAAARDGLDTFYQDRGLSSDTSILPNFAIELALADMKAKGRFTAGRVRRVAIVGPGLDFADKRDGFDFYPQQTIQPFAVIDSLVRLGLATAADLHATTFDLSPRVNHHLEAARRRATSGEAYGLQLPRDTDVGWNPDLVAYWERLGDRIGAATKAMDAPAGAGRIQTRAVRIRPAVVMSITPRDLNIVLQRLEPLAANQRFDIIIATNMLLYYDVFEQSLALTNIARMLRPGGWFLTNNSVAGLPANPMSAAGQTDLVYSSRANSSDTVFWYQAR